MSLFCLPKHFVSKLKESAIRGEIDIKKLYEMSSKERREFFESHTDAELGKLLNEKFEHAMISKQQSALTDWAKSVFTPRAKEKPVYKNIVDRINNLSEQGILNPKSEKAFLEDLVADKLGVSISPEEARNIETRAKKIQEAQSKLGDDLGNPAKEKELTDFLTAKKEMDDYLLSLAPASKLKVTSGTTSRAMLLASVKSPVLNVVSNIEAGFLESTARRVANGSLRGTNNKLASDYVKMVNRIYQKTGYDISRMRDISEHGASGERVLGDVVHAQGPGFARKMGRLAEDLVFKQMMGAPDVAFSSVHFADAINLGARKMANGDMVKANEIMRDAMRLKPRTMEGELLREQGILDAETATFTNKTWASRLSLGIRKIINDLSGNLRLGDQFMSFVKTPANAIALGADYAGLGVPKALVETVSAMKRGELDSPQFKQKVVKDLMRSGLGIAAAYLITSQLKDDDFVGAYDPARAQIEQLRNSNTNSIRVGGKWVSLDFLGPLASPIIGMMYTRKYGKNTIGEGMAQYMKGVGSTWRKLPGIQEVSGYLHQNYSKDKPVAEMATEALDNAMGYIYSHLTPSILSDIARANDPLERKTGGMLESVQSKIPLLREKLPAKQDIFGQDVVGESGLSEILAGARVKTDKEDALIGELNRVSTANDKPINFTNWDKSNSATLAQFKEKVGADEFETAKVKYGQLLQQKLQEAINKPQYGALSEEDKLKIINGLDAKAMDDVFREYRFKYKKPPTKKPRI